MPIFSEFSEIFRRFFDDFEVLGGLRLIRRAISAVWKTPRLNFEKKIGANIEGKTQKKKNFISLGSIFFLFLYMRFLLFLYLSWSYKIMNPLLLTLAKGLAPLLINTLRDLAKDTKNDIDDKLVNTLEFLLKQFKIL